MSGRNIDVGPPESALEGIISHYDDMDDIKKSNVSVSSSKKG